MRKIVQFLSAATAASDSQVCKALKQNGNDTIKAFTYLIRRTRDNSDNSFYDSTLRSFLDDLIDYMQDRGLVPFFSSSNRFINNNSFPYRLKYDEILLVVFRFKNRQLRRNFNEFEFYELLHALDIPHFVKNEIYSKYLCIKIKEQPSNEIALKIIQTELVHFKQLHYIKEMLMLILFKKEPTQTTNTADLMGELLSIYLQSTNNSLKSNCRFETVLKTFLNASETLFVNNFVPRNEE